MRRWMAVFLSVALIALAASRARADDDREVRARAAFVAGRYPEALDLYAKLYAETLHPTYLRNVGRCHQMLHEPDAAITSFRQFLRKAPNLEPEARAEVEEYIREMEALKRQQEQEHAAASVVARPPPARAVVSPPPAPAVSTTAPPPAPVYKRWWFWTALGTAVAGGLVAALVFPRRQPDADCAPGVKCLSM